MRACGFSATIARQCWNQPGRSRHAIRIRKSWRCRRTATRRSQQTFYSDSGPVHSRLVVLIEVIVNVTEDLQYAQLEGVNARALRLKYHRQLPLLSRARGAFVLQ